MWDPQTGGLNSRDLFLAVLETRVCDQGVGSVGFFQGLSSWLGDDRVSSPTIPLCLCVSASKVPLFFFFFNIYLFIWLCRVLVAALSGG